MEGALGVRQRRPSQPARRSSVPGAQGQVWGRDECPPQDFHRQFCLPGPCKAEASKQAARGGFGPP